MLVFIFKKSSLWFQSRHLNYLGSGSQLPRQGLHLVEWALVKSDIGWLLSEACATIALTYLTGRMHLQINMFVADLMFTFFLQKHEEYQTSQLREVYAVYALCRYKLNFSMFNKLSIGMVFSNRVLWSVCGEQHIVQAIACVVWGIPMGPFDQQLSYSQLNPSSGSFIW